MFNADRYPNQTLVFAMGAVCGALIAFFMWAMLLPVDPSPQMFPQADKLKHFVAFGLMAGPGALILPRRYLGFVLMSSIFMAGGVEIVQHVSNLGRQGSVADFVAGAIGACVACWIGPKIVSRLTSAPPEAAS